MFRNMGKNLQLYGKLLLVVGLIAWIVSIVLIARAFEVEIAIPYIIAVLIGGPILVFGLCMVFVGFGKIVEWHELLLMERENDEDSEESAPDEFDLVIPDEKVGQNADARVPEIQETNESGICAKCGAMQVKVFKVKGKSGRVIRLCHDCYEAYKAYMKKRLSGND